MSFNADASKVKNPGPNNVPDEVGHDPYWQTSAEVLLLLDPAFGNRAIATWDADFGLAYFYGKGFLRKNPNDPKDHRFRFDPRAEPFKQKKGKRKIIFYKRVLKYTMNKVFSIWTEYPKSRLGVAQLTDDFDLTEHLKTASSFVQEIFEKGTLSLGGQKDVSYATGRVLDWLMVRNLQL